MDSCSFDSRAKKKIRGEEKKEETPPTPSDEFELQPPKEPNAETPPDHPRVVRPAVQSATAEAAGWFDQWWAIYWRRGDAKKAAQKAFAKNVRTEARFRQVMEATKAQSAYMLSKEKEYRPLGATWLNGERWADEVSAPVNGSGVTPSRPSSTDAVRALALRNLERTGHLL